MTILSDEDKIYGDDKTNMEGIDMRFDDVDDDIIDEDGDYDVEEGNVDSGSDGGYKIAD